MKKVFWILTLALSVPAFAQRGGPVRPPTNQAISCSSDVSEGAACPGYERTWCVNYDTNIIYACDPNTHVWDAVGSGGGSGGGTTITVISNSSQTFSSIDTLDFNSDFGLSDQGGGNILIGVNDSSLSPNMTNATGTLDVSHGGTGSTTSAAALSALGAAGRGINVDITALTALSVPLSPSQGGTGLSNSTGLTDQVAVGQTSTALGYVTLPDCDATGNQLGYVQSTHTFECAADGAGGSGIEVDEEDVDETAAARSRLNFVGAAITADDDGSEVDITLSQSPTTSTSVVGVDRTLTPGVGLTGSSALDLSANRSFSVDSTEAGFLTDRGASVVSAGAGAAGVLDSGPITYLDGAAVARLTAFGDSAGAATTGDSATSFFGAGVLAVTVGGTGSTEIGNSGECLFNNGGVVDADGGCSYNPTSNILTVGASIVVTGTTDNTYLLELKQNSGDVGAPGSGFTRWYASGTAGSEVPKFRTATGGIFQIATLTGTETFTNKTLTTPVITGKVDRNNVSVDDDDCTGEQGLYWYDTTDSAYEFCNANSGTPTTIGTGTGTITNVMGCATGDCEDIVAGAADSLDMSAGEFLRIPVDNTIDTAGKIGVDTTSGYDHVQVYMNALAVAGARVLSPLRTAGAVLESLVEADDSYEFFMAPEPVTIVGVACRCRGTCTVPALFTLEDRGGNAMTITGTNPTCATTGNATFAAVTAGNTLVEGEGLAFDVDDTPATTTGDTYTVTVQYLVTPQ